MISRGCLIQVQKLEVKHRVDMGARAMGDPLDCLRRKVWAMRETATDQLDHERYKAYSRPSDYSQHSNKSRSLMLLKPKSTSHPHIADDSQCCSCRLRVQRGVRRAMANPSRHVFEDKKRHDSYFPGKESPTTQGGAVFPDLFGQPRLAATYSGNSQTI